jgi:hypothetical protein
VPNLRDLALQAVGLGSQLVTSVLALGCDCAFALLLFPGDLLLQLVHPQPELCNLLPECPFAPRDERLRHPR